MDFGQGFGKILIIIGIIIFLGGIIIYFGGKLGIGRLPGDFIYRKDNITFYFPLVTCIIISVILTIILNLFNRR